MTPQVPVVAASAPDALGRAAEVLDDGVVALPTDTVYGLAARLDRPAALRAVFDLKGRPKDLALPVLVTGPEQLDGLVAEWPPGAALLARRCWPGPLTLVVPGRRRVAAAIGGHATVGVRAPDERFVRGLLERVGPLAVTSANRHGRSPATTAPGVAQALSSPEEASNDVTLSLVIDGGPVPGTPSTVVEVTGGGLVVLREGAISARFLEGLVAS